MCGICGTIGSAEATVLASMTHAMAHRGPDGSGVNVFDGDPPAGLGHRRLAIIDPSPAGAQPMGYADRWWITYNGELYNFRELRRGLEGRGERFVTECDTEVLLRMFVVHGPRMLELLNGIFALAIWDDLEKRLFLARDRLGVKPLYYTRTPGCFAFASEVKALLPLVERPTLDLSALADYLTFLWVPDPKTAFREIVKLPAGHHAWVDADTVSIRQYWDLRFSPEERSEDDWADEVRDTVQRSVVRQMVSDVPLGSFLSGGVDSSAIAAAMKAEAAMVDTYTIGFAEEDLKHEIVPDDVRYARRVAAVLGTEYHESILRPDVLDLLPKTVWHLEEPVADPAAISTYLICREARRRMPVMLSGMGADELFAGYPRHLAYRIARALDRLPAAVRARLEKLARPVAHPGPPGRLRGPRRNLWKYMRATGLSDFDRYLSFSSYYTTAELRSVLMPDVADELGAYDPFAVHRGYLQRDTGSDELSRMLYLDAKTFLPCLNLTYTDKMAMAASVEVRVPLLDDELVALSARIPSQLKLKGWRRKYIFKRSQQERLPREVVWRRKAGFGAPIRSWLVGDLAPLVDDLLSEQTLRRRGLIDPAQVTRMRAENAAGRSDYTLQLYALLSLELWSQTFLDQAWYFDGSVRAPILRSRA
jgi:asparagine synthase (glutamine-hydrolysing)